MKKESGHGKILLINGNPMYKSWYNQLLYDQLFLAMTKNVIFDAVAGTDDGKPIPGGEAGVRVRIAFSLLNIYESEIKNIKIRIWLPEKLEAVTSTLLNGCSVSTENPGYTMNLTLVKPDSHILCPSSSVAAFGKLENNFVAEITDHSLTQVKKDILMAVIGVEYNDSSNNALHREDVGALRADASLAALLRGALNPDPSAFYPVKGVGQYVDNVLQLENKEDTAADDVDYVAIIPLVTPLVDGSDQKLISRALKFLPSYYGTKTDIKYYYPFLNEEVASGSGTQLKNWDHLDFKYLNKKDVYLGADWDIPVRIKKIVRDSSFPDVTTESVYDIVNINYSTTINSMETVLEQLFFDQADKFFEHATQRLMVYVDTSKPEGAKQRY